MNTINENKSPDSDDAKGGLYVVLAFVVGLPLAGLLLKVIADWIGE